MKRKDNAGLHITLTFLVLLPRKTGTSTRKVSCHIVLFCMVALEVCSCAQNLFILHSIHVQTTLPLWRTVAVRNVGAKYWNMPHEISADSDTGSMSLLCTLFLTWKQTLLLPPLPPLVLTFKEYLNVRQMSSCQGGVDFTVSQFIFIWTLQHKWRQRAHSFWGLGRTTHSKFWQILRWLTSTWQISCQMTHPWHSGSPSCSAG